MVFKIGDRVKVSSINSRIFCGFEGIITEIPSSHVQRDYGVNIWQDGIPTIGFDEDQLILLSRSENEVADDIETDHG